MTPFRATIEWQRSTEGFGYKEYDRSHRITYGSGTSIHASAAPDFLGKPDLVNPEEALVCQSPGSWGQRRAFSPASWDHLIARVMGPPARVADPFSPGSWGQPIARVMGPPIPAFN